MKVEITLTKEEVKALKKAEWFRPYQRGSRGTGLAGSLKLFALSNTGLGYNPNRADAPLMWCVINTTNENGFFVESRHRSERKAHETLRALRRQLDQLHPGNLLKFEIHQTTARKGEFCDIPTETAPIDHEWMREANLLQHGPEEEEFELAAESLRTYLGELFPESPELHDAFLCTDFDRAVTDWLEALNHRPELRWKHIA